MNLARRSITQTNPVQIFNTQFDADCQIFTTVTPVGFAVYQAWPLKLLRKRELSGGTLAAAVPCHTSSLLFLLGGGRSPLYPPNKVILWDDVAGVEVAELEFREKVGGLACRRGWLAVALRRRVVVFEVHETVVRRGEYDTCDNPRGILAMATGPFATLLAIPGRQMGHVQLVQLPPCRPPEPLGPPPPLRPAKPPTSMTRHPVSIIAAHESPLTTLSVTPSGRLVATTSLRGTLVRIWETSNGKLLKEFRRGSDKAEIYGVAFRSDEKEVAVWSDKGTIHVFSLTPAGGSNRQSSLSPLAPFLPLPKYFDSQWSYAQYRIPAQAAHISLSSTSSVRSPATDLAADEKCVVGWIKIPAETEESPQEYQLIALTYSGGWYRLSLPLKGPLSNLSDASTVSQDPYYKASSTSRQRTSSVSSISSAPEKGKGKERDKERRDGRDLILEEYRKYGRWDGWG
ncbi:WD40-repeat-containing domain protein [Pisolithus croceorrhizus]|nr:WD40-repeat-containing domain protein [Pisolithus croceorrhizus]